MASIEEINDAIFVAKKYGTGEILLFHCVSGYQPQQDSNINLIKTFKEI